MGNDARGEFELVHLQWAGLTVNEEIRRDYPQLSAALEDEFEIEIPYQYISAWRTFGDAADYIATTLGE